uniref:Beta-lactamase-related domain-containing protein n=1 Tax=Chrysotila carterae TaxID=13221 RepID=A0A7S4BDV2_CHRCT
MAAAAMPGKQSSLAAALVASTAVATLIIVSFNRRRARQLLARAKHAKRHRALEDGVLSLARRAAEFASSSDSWWLGWRRSGAPTLRIVPPEAVGISSARLTQITRWSDGWVAAGKLPGMLTMIARHGQVCYMHSSGYADVATKQPLTERTLMRMYSMTKPVVSVAAMILYERGLFQLDEPISKHLRCFARPVVMLDDGTTEPANREITFRDLLTHTSGLSYGDSDNRVDEMYEEAGCGWDMPNKMTLEEFVERLATLPLAFQPGFSWRYSYSTDVLGRLLEVLSGMPLDELLARELFEPLKMVDSGFCVPPDKLHRLAQVYEVANDEDAYEEEGATPSLKRFERFDSREQTMAPPSPLMEPQPASPPSLPELAGAAAALALVPMVVDEDQNAALPPLPPLKRSLSAPSLNECVSGGGRRGYRRGYRAWRLGAAKGAKDAEAKNGKHGEALDRAALEAALNSVKWHELPQGDEWREARLKNGGQNGNHEHEPSSREREVSASVEWFKPMDDTDAGYVKGRPKFLSGGAGVVSTAVDFSRFCQMLLNYGELDGVRILSRKTIEYMVLNHLPLDAAGRRVDIDTVATDSGFNETSFDGIGFGLGWSVMVDPVKASIISSVGEFGWGGWASTFFLVDKKEDMFVLSLAQLAPSDRYPIRRQLRCLVYQSLDE